MKKTKHVSLRDFHHNLSMYLGMSKINPIYITKNGKEQVVIIDPDTYEYKKRRVKKSSLDKRDAISDFIGMYKNRKDWEGKSSSTIAAKLRKDSWYGD